MHFLKRLQHRGKLLSRVASFSRFTIVDSATKDDFPFRFRLRSQAPNPEGFAEFLSRQTGLDRSHYLLLDLQEIRIAEDHDHAAESVDCHYP